MEAQKYKIKTVQNMIDCTNEANLDNFLTDLKALLTAAHSFRTIAKLIGEIKGLPKEMQEIETKGFTWIDDGFDSVQDFFEWFNEDYKGKIIHWTDYSY